MQHFARQDERLHWELLELLLATANPETNTMAVESCIVYERGEACACAFRRT